MRREQPGPWRDNAIEQAVGNLLRLGVMTAAAVALAGGVSYLLQHGLNQVDYRIFRGAPRELRQVPSILVGVRHGDSRSVIQLGLLLLIATPVARVALSLVGFFRERDRAYLMITAFVLTLLLVSVFGKL